MSRPVSIGCEDLRVYRNTDVWAGDRMSIGAQSPASPGYALVASLYEPANSDAAENIQVIEDLYEVPTVAGWVAPYAPDSDSANVGIGTTGTGMNYYNLQSTEWIEWTIPADITTEYDRLLSVHFQVTTGASASIIKNPGVDDTDIGTIDTSGGSNAPETEQVVTLSETVTGGDTIRLIGDASTARIHGIRLYKNGATPSFGESWYPDRDNYTQIDGSASSLCCAFAIAPTGDSTKWAGGTHNRSDYVDCQERSPVYTFQLDGSSIAAVTADTPFFETGDNCLIRRVSNIDYDGVTNTDIGTMTTNYSASQSGIVFNPSVNPDETLDHGKLYPGMMTVDDAVIPNIYVQGGRKYPTDQSTAETFNETFSDSYRVAGGPTSGAGLYLNAKWSGFDLPGQFDQIAFNDTDKDKCYASMTNGGTLSAGTNYGGQMLLSLESNQALGVGSYTLTGGILGGSIGRPLRGRI